MKTPFATHTFPQIIFYVFCTLHVSFGARKKEREKERKRQEREREREREWERRVSQEWRTPPHKNTWRAFCLTIGFGDGMSTEVLQLGHERAVDVCLISSCGHKTRSVIETICSSVLWVCVVFQLESYVSSLEDSVRLHFTNWINY